MPPITRTALVSGLAVFLLTLLVFHPHAGGDPAATPLTSGVVLIPPGDPRTESLVLLDGSVAYLPGRISSAGAGQGEVGRPLDAPFAKFDPILLVDPGKYDVSKLNDRLPLESPKASVPTPTEALPLSQWEPYTTFGVKSLKASNLGSRGGFFEVYPISGAKKPIIYGTITHPDVKFPKIDAQNTKKSLLSSNIELILGVDSMGVHGPGALVRSSGDAALDAGVLRWATGVDWARQLPPGSYRLTVGP